MTIDMTVNRTNKTMQSPIELRVIASRGLGDARYRASIQQCQALYTL